MVPEAVPDKEGETVLTLRLPEGGERYVVLF